MPTVDQARITKRIEIRETLGLLGEGWQGEWSDFLQLVIDECEKQLPPPPSRNDEPMTREQARRFGTKPMQLGAEGIRGVPIYQVPTGYIAAITSDSDFKRELKRYARSIYFRELQDQQGMDDE